MTDAYLKLNGTESMPIVASIEFWERDLLPNARSYQSRNLRNRKVQQLGHTLPSKLSKFKKLDFKYLQHYLCEHSRFMYVESDTYSEIGKKQYEIKKHFDGACSLNSWSNGDKIRLNYFMNQKGRKLVGKVIDLRKHKDNTGRTKEQKNTLLASTEEIEFSKKASKKNTFNLQFD